MACSASRLRARMWPVSGSIGGGGHHDGNSAIDRGCGVAESGAEVVGVATVVDRATGASGCRLYAG